MAAFAEERELNPMASFTGSYEENLTSYAKLIDDKHHGGKHTFVLDAISGSINMGYLNEFCKKVEEKKGEVDFLIISLIRILYLLKDNSDLQEYFAPIRCAIEKALCSFPFWPHTDKLVEGCDELIFWSENHVFMFLGSAYLFKQWMEMNYDRNEGLCLVTDLEYKLLSTYLSAHISFGGVYECNSNVYLPYTLSALMNLIDFAEDQQIREQAFQIANTIAFQIMMCTTDAGIFNLSSSTRAFARTRQRTWGQNINQLVKLMCGQSPDPSEPYCITDFLLTTSWRPDQKALDAVHFAGAAQVVVSHPEQSTRELYSSCNTHHLAEEELVPFYWSAGLVVHPEYVRDTKRYQSVKRLQNTRHVSLLSWLPSAAVEHLMHSYAHFSCGQSYTGVTLNVYKQQGGLCMTSFENYCGGICGYQQLPWMVNFNGLGVWSQSGSGTEGIAGFGITNTHNPYVSQRGNILVAAYVTPAAIRSSVLVSSLLGSHVRFFWPPRARLDEETRLEQWWCAQRGRCYVGVYCTAHTSSEIGDCKDAQIEPVQGVRDLMERRVCRQSQHSWVVHVGVVDQFPTFHDFVLSCEQLVVAERQGGHSFKPGRAITNLFKDANSKPPINSYQDYTISVSRLNEQIVQMTVPYTN